MHDELVCWALKKKSLTGSARAMVNDIEELHKVWDMLNTRFNCPEKYIVEALDPIVKFRKYKAFENSTEFYSVLRSAMLGTQKAGLLHRLINYQMVPSIMGRMPLSDWKQLARE
jgi:hypothetical protein